jgi:hypothetical protein
MFNTRQILNAETLHAEYYEYDDVNKSYHPSISFRYKTYDDTQYRESRTQFQPGNLTSKFSLSIKSSAPLNFKVKDKIKLLYDGRTYEVTGVQQLQNVNPLMSLILPSAKGQFPKLIHLNKDDID